MGLNEHTARARGIPYQWTGASPRAIVDAEFVHPTFSEGLQTLVMKLPRYALA